MTNFTEILKANPYVSFCTYPQGFSPVLSVNGKVVFVEDLTLKNVLSMKTLEQKASIIHPTTHYLKSFILRLKNMRHLVWKKGQRLIKPK
jgi:uncharacterized pyridoxamine 5'-phosphate oxidase family protein